MSTDWSVAKHIFFVKASICFPMTWWYRSLMSRDIEVKVCLKLLQVSPNLFPRLLSHKGLFTIIHLSASHCPSQRVNPFRMVQLSQGQQPRFMCNYQPDCSSCFHPESIRGWLNSNFHSSREITLAKAFSIPSSSWNFPYFFFASCTG